MFKSRRSYNPYYSKRRPKRRFSNLWIVLSIPVFLLLLELLTRILVVLTGQSGEISSYSYQGEPPEFTAFRLNFLNENQQPYRGLSNTGKLVAHRNTSVGYELAGSQEHQYWQINEQGFRETEPLPLAKPQNEIRIFILGGSTAFGQGNQSNDITIAGQLQKRLNQRISQQKSSPEKYQPGFIPFYRPERVKALAKPPRIRGGNYRVINGGVPGYTSGNTLAQLALQILPYKPDVIVVLDGYEDILLPSSEKAAQIPHLEDFLNHPPAHFAAYLGQPIQQFFQSTYLNKAVQKWILESEPTLAQRSVALGEPNQPLEDYLPPTEEELELRLQRYQEHHKQMVRLAAGAGIPVIIALQPEITSLITPENPEVGGITQDLSQSYIEQLQQNYPRFGSINQQLANNLPRNVKVLDFYKNWTKLAAKDKKLSDGESAFSDVVHLSEGGNRVISNQLYQTITTLTKIQVIPENFNLK